MRNYTGLELKFYSSSDFLSLVADRATGLKPGAAPYLVLPPEGEIKLKEFSSTLVSETKSGDLLDIPLTIRSIETPVRGTVIVLPNVLGAVPYGVRLLQPKFVWAHEAVNHLGALGVIGLIGYNHE